MADNLRLSALRTVLLHKSIAAMVNNVSPDSSRFRTTCSSKIAGIPMSNDFGQRIQQT